MKTGRRVTLLHDTDGVRAGTGATVVKTYTPAPRYVAVRVRYADGTTADLFRESVRPRTKTEDADFAARDYRVEYLDAGPDKLGRRRYFLYWNDVGGVFRPEPSKDDGKPVGYRRAQIFVTDRAPPKGATVVNRE